MVFTTKPRGGLAPNEVVLEHSLASIEVTHSDGYWTHRIFRGHQVTNIGMFDLLVLWPCYPKGGIKYSAPKVATTYDYNSFYYLSFLEKVYPAPSPK